MEEIMRAAEAVPLTDDQMLKLRKKLEQFEREKLAAMIATLPKGAQS